MASAKKQPAPNKKITRKPIRKRKYTKPVTNPSWYGHGSKQPNPFGRPKLTAQQAQDSKAFREACRERSPHALEVIEGLAERADRDSVRLSASEVILAYGHGRPIQTNEVSGPNGGPMISQNLPLTKEQLLEELVRRGLPIDILKGE